MLLSLARQRPKQHSDVGERSMALEEIDRESGAHRTCPSGICNPAALAINPATQALWAVVNERDEFGADLVPDYMTSVKPGAFYGWPYSDYGNHVDPRVHPRKPEVVRKAIAPDHALGSHVADDLSNTVWCITSSAALNSRNPL